MNIILSGFQGSGKTSAGFTLAKMTGLPFYDIDHMLLWHHMPHYTHISSLHTALGETAFREKEKEMLQTLASFRPGIISLGGGTLVHPEAEKIACSLGRIAYLYLPYEAVEKKLLEKMTRREMPSYLDPHDPIASLKKLYHCRHDIYSRVAFAVIDVQKNALQEVAEMVWTKLTSEKKSGK